MDVQGQVVPEDFARHVFESFKAADPGRRHAIGEAIVDLAEAVFTNRTADDALERLQSLVGTQGTR